MTPAAIDFINQPATVDVEPLLARMPRRLTPLDEGLRSYLAANAGPGELSFDAVASVHGPLRLTFAATSHPGDREIVLSSTDRPPAIETHGLHRSFGETEALRGVDLTIPAGEIHGFLGPNGAGKTTLVRILCTLLRPTAGAARVSGLDVVEQARQVRFRIGVALQEAALDPKQSGRELLNLQARLFGLPADERRRRVAELSGLVDIGEALDRRVKTYSGGMRRRLDLALSLMHEPDVLFLDEPTTGLDPVSRRQIWQEVRRLNTERRVTVFLTTQYLEEADELADRVSIISAGRIAAQGTPDELKREIGRDVVVVRGDGPLDQAQQTLTRLTDVEGVNRSGDEFTLAVLDGPAAVPAMAEALPPSTASPFARSHFGGQRSMTSSCGSPARGLRPATRSAAPMTTRRTSPHDGLRRYCSAQRWREHLGASGHPPTPSRSFATFRSSPAGLSARPCGSPKRSFRP